MSEKKIPKMWNNLSQAKTLIEIQLKNLINFYRLSKQICLALFLLKKKYYKFINLYRSNVSNWLDLLLLGESHQWMKKKIFRDERIAKLSCLL